MDEVTRGLMAEYQNGILDPLQPWHRPCRKGDLRWFPAKTGGRQMRHPFYDPIIYPRVPDKTLNFGYDLLQRGRTSTVQTLSAAATAKFLDPTDSVILQEVFLAQTASTLTELFHRFHRYWIDALPPGQYVGWIPRDLTWRVYDIEILEVVCGAPDEFVIEELGNDRPFLMREQLTVTFRVPREFFHPSGEIVGVGV